MAAIAAAPMILGFTAPAGARSSAKLTSAGHIRPAAVPNTDVTGAGATLTYTPAKLKAKVWPTGTACSKKTTSFTITNTTKKPITVTFGRQKLPIPKLTIEGICFTGDPGKVTLGLKGSTATLAVTLTAA
jgi:hypothetical protein